jgi:hypothetical protein
MRPVCYMSVGNPSCDGKNDGPDGIRPDYYNKRPGFTSYTPVKCYHRNTGGKQPKKEASANNCEAINQTRMGWGEMGFASKAMIL